jgi:glycosyltransferase involved in cell wall biosynthesis
MRILRVAQKLYPEVLGGGTYHVHAMSRDQAAMGHDVTVVTVSDDERLARREERDGYTVVRCRPTVELLGNRISVEVARAVRRADDYDVVHAHSHLYFSTNLAALGRRLGDIPLAITNHGLYSQNAPEWLFEFYLRTVGRLTFDSADTVFCYTHEDRERVRKFGVGTDITVVPNGIDTERFRPDGPTSGRIDREGFTVLFVGRLVEGKRPDDAIGALERVRESHRDASLVLAGDGPLRSDLEASVAERGMSEAVTFLGQLPYDEMPQLYRSADALVLPSRAEGLPRTVLEALASGTPAVTSALRQLTPIVEKTGATVFVGDVAGFAAALSDLAADPARRATLGERGRELVTAEHQWKDTVRRTTARLEELCE